MTGLWLVSYVALWFLTLVEGLVVLALARENQLMDRRLAEIRCLLQVANEAKPA